MAISVERTKEAILVKLPLDTDFIDIQQMLNYFEYVSLVRKSKATDEEIETLAQEAKKGWWEKNKDRFKGIEGFEGLATQA